MHAELGTIDEAFKIAERALPLFDWPHKYEIWVQYLRLAVSYFKTNKVERLRELFSKCLEELPKGGADKEDQ